MKKYRNGVLSAFFGVFQQLITLVFSLIVPRLFIQSFGSEVNGLLSSLASLFSYLALLEAGVGTMTIQALYGPIGRKDTTAINEIMSATSYYYKRAGAYYFIGIIAIAIIYPLTVSTTIPASTIVAVTVFSGIGGVINFWVQGKYLLLFQAEGKLYLTSIVATVIYVVQNAMKIVLLKLGYNVIAIYISYFVISLCQMLFYLCYIRRNYKWLSLKERQNRKVFSQSKSVLILEIARLICGHTDILVLTYIAKDLTACSVYAVYSMIFNAVSNMLRTIFGSFSYLLGQTYNNDRSNYLSIHEKYEAISMSGAFAAYSIAYVLTGPFVRLYTAGITDARYIDPYLPILFTVMKLLPWAREASGRVIDYARHFNQMKWRAVLEAAINLVASIILVVSFGIYGVVLGTIVAYLWRVNNMITYANKVILKRKLWKTYRRIITNVCCFTGVYVINQHINLQAPNLMSFFLIALVCGTAICFLYCVQLACFERESTKFLLHSLEAVLRKRKHNPV